MTRAQGKHREFSLNQSVATLLLLAGVRGLKTVQDLVDVDFYWNETKVLTGALRVDNLNKLKK